MLIFTSLPLMKRSECTIACIESMRWSSCVVVAAPIALLAAISCALSARRQTRGSSRSPA